MNLFSMKGAWSRPFAFVYNTFIVEGIKDIYEEGVEMLPPLPEGAKLLDVGCGPGNATRIIAARRPGVRVTGMDLSPAMIHAAKSLGRDLPNLEYIEGDAMTLSFKPGSFDVCITTASIKHWPDKLRGVREIHRVLKPGGMIFVLEADKECTKAAARWFVAKWRYVLPGTRPLVCWHFRRFIAGQGMSTADLDRLLRDAGFSEITATQMPERPFVHAKAFK